VSTREQRIGSGSLLAPLFLLLMSCGGSAPPVAPRPTPLVVRHVTDAGAKPVRLARDPRSGDLFVLKLDGTVSRLLVTDAALLRTIYTAADTGVAAPQGMAFGPDGALYLVGNDVRGNDTSAIVRKGAPAGDTDARLWTTVARTDPYPLSQGFDHFFNGVAVSPDGRYVFLNSGSRTEHGEIESSQGRYPGLREIPLTAAILRVPADAHDLILHADARVEQEGYVFARGVRNAFDLAFSADGELFAIDNSGDRDDPDELNWIQAGHHYGFPWRMGTTDTPQQFPGYDPAADKLLNGTYRTLSSAAFYDDPTYPPRPATAFTDPVENVGPDARGVRDPQTGVAARAAGSIGSFTAHRSPLGLVFDTRGELPPAFLGSAFVLGWTAGADGESADGPFFDESQDLLHLVLSRNGDGYRMSATSLVCGFDHPVDAEIRDGRLYVLEYGGNGSIWEVTLPSTTPAPGCVRVSR
jgi:glucose/arabinose dehydrogenase